MSFLQGNRFVRTEFAARRVLRAYENRCGALDLPVPVEAVAERLCDLTLLRRKLGRLGKGTLGGLDLDRRLLLVEERIDYQPRIAFTVAHEIGHYTLHVAEGRQQLLPNADYFVPNARERESEADLFAAALLMPQVDLFRLVSDKPKYANAALRVSALAYTFGVSWSAMTRRILTLNDYYRVTKEESLPEGFDLLAEFCRENTYSNPRLPLVSGSVATSLRSRSSATRQYRLF